MNRREFLRLAIAGTIGLDAIALVNEDKVLNELKNLTDDEFVAFITAEVTLYVHNPAYCAIITNIAIPDEESK